MRGGGGGWRGWGGEGGGGGGGAGGGGGGDEGRWGGEGRRDAAIEGGREDGGGTTWSFASISLRTTTSPVSKSCEKTKSTHIWQDQTGRGGHSTPRGHLCCMCPSFTVSAVMRRSTSGNFQHMSGSAGGAQPSRSSGVLISLCSTMWTSTFVASILFRVLSSDHKRHRIGGRKVKGWLHGPLAGEAPQAIDPVHQKGVRADPKRERTDLPL